MQICPLTCNPSKIRLDICQLPNDFSSLVAKKAAFTRCVLSDSAPIVTAMARGM